MAAPRRRLASASRAPRGRLLAIDYGRKRLGLALSDELGLAARPLATLQRTNRRNDLRRLREIVRRHQVAKIVVGQPLRLDGTAGDRAEEAARFAGRLEKELGLPVVLADERLSSWAAEQMMVEAETPQRKRAAKRDQIAAALILRDYLEAGRAGD